MKFRAGRSFESVELPAALVLRQGKWQNQISRNVAAVAQVLSYGIPFSKEVRLALAEHFGSSESAITVDLRIAAAMRHAGVPAGRLPPYPP